MMNWMMRTVIPALGAAAMMLSAPPVRATEADSPELTLTSRPQQDSRLRDGAIIGSARVTYRPSHTGFRVWLEAEKSGTAPDRYVLRGKSSASHRLKVRLAGGIWQPDSTESRSGVIRQTADEQVSVDIVADGNQEAAADEYVITANAVAMVP